MWWRHYGDNKKLSILLIKEGKEIIGIAPFMRVKYRMGLISVDVLENFCATECDYSGIILTDKKEESLSILLNYLGEIIRTSNVVIRVSNIPEDSGFLQVLREQYHLIVNSLSISEQTVTSCPYINTLKNWEEYSHTLTKHGRYKVNKLRREIQKLKDNYQAEFQHFTDYGNLHKQLDALFKLHQKRWKERNIRSKFLKPEVRAFYRDISEAFCENNWMDLSFLNIGGKTVSGSWGFIYNNQYYYMTSTFDPGYSSLNAGHMITMRLIERAIQSGLTKFDFLKGDEFFKSYWTHQKLDNIQITISNKGIKGSYRVILLWLILKYWKMKERSLRENLDLMLKKLHLRINGSFIAV
jgi:CelD/BcsL family acetyltransferase involved in cellulose biosynthesis